MISQTLHVTPLRAAACLRMQPASYPVERHASCWGRGVAWLHQSLWSATCGGIGAASATHDDRQPLLVRLGLWLGVVGWGGGWGCGQTPAATEVVVVQVAMVQLVALFGGYGWEVVPFASGSVVLALARAPCFPPPLVAQRTSLGRPYLYPLVCCIAGPVEIAPVLAPGSPSGAALVCALRSLGSRGWLSSCLASHACGVRPQVGGLS